MQSSRRWKYYYKNKELKHKFVCFLQNKVVLVKGKLNKVFVCRKIVIPSNREKIMSKLQNKYFGHLVCSN